MARGSLLDKVRCMVDFSEDADIEQGLYMNRMKQKGEKGRRTEENPVVAPQSQEQLTLKVVVK